MAFTELAAKTAAKKAATKKAPSAASKFKSWVKATPKAAAQTKEAMAHIEKSVKLLKDVQDQMKAAGLPQSVINAMWKAGAASFK